MRSTENANQSAGREDHRHAGLEPPTFATFSTPLTTANTQSDLCRLRKMDPKCVHLRNFTMTTVDTRDNSFCVSPSSSETKLFCLFFGNLNPRFTAILLYRVSDSDSLLRVFKMFFSLAFTPVLRAPCPSLFSPFSTVFLNVFPRIVVVSCNRPPSKPLSFITLQILSLKSMNSSNFVTISYNACSAYLCNF